MVTGTTSENNFSYVIYNDTENTLLLESIHSFKMLKFKVSNSQSVYKITLKLILVLIMVPPSLYSRQRSLNTHSHNGKNFQRSYGFGLKFIEQ